MPLEFLLSEDVFLLKNQKRSVEKVPRPPFPKPGTHVRFYQKLMMGNA
jgi:hypothetical protein